MEAQFIAGPAGPLFSVYHAASAPRGDPLGLVYLPPFAEEMNRARRMAALQARRLSELGIHVLLLDPFGTGDSAGDFGDARWEIWREDVQRAVDWIGPRCDGRVGLWGVRLGALLAADVAAAGIRPFSRLLLWQPLLSGERFLTQFLRLRMAAGLAQETGQESTKDLRARLARGERLEVGGYELSPALAEAIVSLKLANLLTSLSNLPSDWLEVGASGAAELPPGSRQVVETLRDQGCNLRARAVEGAAFWSIQEFTLAPALLDATDELFHR